MRLYRDFYRSEIGLKSISMNKTQKKQMDITYFNVNISLELPELY